MSAPRRSSRRRSRPKPTATIRLSPQLEYDDNNPAREKGEALIRQLLEEGADPPAFLQPADGLFDNTSAFVSRFVECDLGVVAVLLIVLVRDDRFDAVDRLVHHSVIVELNVASYRLETAKSSRAPKDDAPAPKASPIQ